MNEMIAHRWRMAWLTTVLICHWLKPIVIEAIVIAAFWFIAWVIFT